MDCFFCFCFFVSCLEREITFCNFMFTFSSEKGSSLKGKNLPYETKLRCSGILHQRKQIVLFKSRSLFRMEANTSVFWKRTYFKRKQFALRGKRSLLKRDLFWKGIYSKRRIFIPCESKFARCSVDPFLKRIGVQDCKQEVTKVVYLVDEIPNVIFSEKKKEN